VGACGGSGAVGNDPDLSSGPISARVLIAVEHRPGAVTPTSWHASAHFVRTGSLEPSDVATLLRWPVWARGASEPVPAADCRLASEPDDIDGALQRVESQGPLELLDVGELVLRTPSGLQPLPARETPLLAGVLEGVAYTFSEVKDPASAALDPGLPDADASAEWSITGVGFGGGSGARGVVVPSAVGAFQAAAVAPREPALESVGGQPVGASAQALVLGQSNDLEVRWTAGAPSGRVTVELEAERRSLVCRSGDSGRFVVPAALVRSLGPAAKATLRVTRTARAALDGQGIASGELVVAVSSAAPVQVR
jgi:hypothetical protein